MAKRKEHRTPRIGSRFEKEFKGKVRTLHVVEHEGRTCYKMDGKIFGSPSGAAKALTRTEVNRWKFWRMG